MPVIFEGTPDLYQLKVCSEHNPVLGESVIVFRYGFSQVAVNYMYEQGNQLHFVIHLLAIVGGLFTVMKMLDQVVYKGTSLVFKEQINKLQ